MGRTVEGRAGVGAADAGVERGGAGSGECGGRSQRRHVEASTEGGPELPHHTIETGALLKSFKFVKNFAVVQKLFKLLKIIESYKSFVDENVKSFQSFVLVELPIFWVPFGVSLLYECEGWECRA